MSEEVSEELHETEKKLFEAIEKNDVVLLKTLITEVKSVNIVDENSMTPLQHAAYKGNKEIVQMLLDQVCLHLFILNFSHRILLNEQGLMIRQNRG